MSTKREWKKYNRITTKDVKATSLKVMFNKARKQYIVLRKMKLLGCIPQLCFAFMRIRKNIKKELILKKRHTKNKSKKGE